MAYPYPYLKLPLWVKNVRPDWEFVGAIARNPVTSGPNRITTEDISFWQLVQKALRSDPRNLRRADYYPEGAAMWRKRAK